MTTHACEVYAEAGHCPHVNDPEAFCPRCSAGMESSEHHETCDQKIQVNNWPAATEAPWWERQGREWVWWS